jgi:glucose-1-phosphate thymidylyltransferase
VLRGPIVIGSGTKVVRSFIGPFTSIAEECAIEDSEIEYSIVLGNSSIRGVSRIEHSLIGKDVEVTRAPNTPNAHQLMVGDHSRVQIRS